MRHRDIKVHPFMSLFTNLNILWVNNYIIAINIITD